MSEILFPIGRMIGGSLEKMHPRTENDGKTPKKNSAGEPMMQCNFGVAIPKTQADWRSEPWGNIMYNIGVAAEPVLYASPSFSWKVIDGDSPLPNKNGKAPKDQTGYIGNWILWFSQGWLPKLCNADGTVELQPGAIQAGQYVQVLADVASNGAKPPQTPGLYLNPRAVALAADGDRIVTEVDTAKAGFGGALPTGARPVQPAVAGFAPAPIAPPAVPVAPNPAFMAPPVPAAHVMTPKANGASYEACIKAGWTDELLRQNGMML